MANCVIVIDEDLVAHAAEWDNLAALPLTKKYLEIRVQHVQGGPTNVVKFAGDDLVGIRHGPDGIVVDQINMNQNQTSVNQYEESAFRYDESQSIGESRPPGLWDSGLADVVWYYDADTTHTQEDVNAVANPTCP